jgi:hypothetical protein
MRAHPRHIWVHRDNLIDYGRILQHRSHLLEELGRVHHGLDLQCAISQYNIITHIKKAQSNSTHHIRVIRIQPHVAKRVQPRHRTEPHMAVQLRKWVVWVLPRLHRWQGCGVELEEGEEELEAPPAERAMPLTM